METPNLRTMKVTMDKGKDVRDTKMLKGNAVETGKMRESNNTDQYQVAPPKFGDLGGENRNK